MTTDKHEKLSKFLSLVLRHRPDLAGLTPDNSGWVDVDVLLEGLARNGKALTREELGAIVAASDKQRFCFNEDRSRIRANQGHSYQVELGYAPAKPPVLLFHGTATKYLASIRVNGLKKQSRHHVHLSSNLETASRVGQRHGELVLLTVLAREMFDNGHQFFLSNNGVWLTEYVPTTFIKFPQ